MANSKQILDKIARNLDQLQIAYTRDSSNDVIVTNGSNNLTLSYDLAVIQSPMGGVDATSAPYLGIGTANPGRIRIQGAAANSASNFNVGSLIDTSTAAQVFHVCSAFANDLVLAKQNTGSGSSLADTIIRGQVDWVNLGQ